MRNPLGGVIQYINQYEAVLLGSWCGLMSFAALMASDSFPSMLREHAAAGKPLS